MQPLSLCNKDTNPYLITGCPILSAGRTAVKAKLRLRKFFFRGIILVLAGLKARFSGSIGQLAENVRRYGIWAAGPAAGKLWPGAKKAGTSDSSGFCETAFHLIDILQSYRISTVSPKPRFIRRKELINTILIITAGAAFASAFSKNFGFFSKNFLRLVNFGVFEPVRAIWGRVVSRWRGLFSGQNPACGVLENQFLVRFCQRYLPGQPAAGATQ